MRAELIDFMGNDLRVVNAARVSFNKESNFERVNVRMEGPENILSEKDKKLLKYLATHGHFTPFTHPQVTMRETVPIFVARQRFKHSVGFTYNEVSRRYVDDEPEFFTPSEWRGKPINAKQGSSDEVITSIKRPNLYRTHFEEEPILMWRDEDIQTAYERVIRLSEHLYKDMIKAGVAPEQARIVLPQSMYTSYYTTGSLAAWSRAYKQRIDSHSQQEIRELAIQWDTIIRPLFPVSWESLVD